MEVSTVNCGEVAVVDGTSSGRAGTGYEYPGATAAGAACNVKIWSRGGSGPGVFFTREPRRRTGPAAWTHRYFCTVRIRTRPTIREFLSEWARKGGRR